MSFSDVPPAERSLVPTGGTLPDAFFQPPLFVTPTNKNNPLILNISGTNYAGSLTNNFSDRITRLNQFLVTILRLLYRLMGSLDFKVGLIINFPNPFDKPDYPPPKTITAEGFAGLIEAVNLLHRKVDNLHEDLPLIMPVASIVEHWQLKKEALRPQCIFLWGEWTEGDEKIGPPKWQTAVPYFDFSLVNSFDNSFGYWKGERQGLLTLSDNSKVIIYARDDEEIDRVFTRLLVGIREDMKEDLYIKKGEYNGPPFSTRYVRLRRVDYYSTGQLRGPMDAYQWFSASPVVLL